VTATHDTRPVQTADDHAVWLARIASGMLLAFVVAAVATVLGKLVPIVAARCSGSCLARSPLR